MFRIACAACLALLVSDCSQPARETATDVAAATSSKAAPVTVNTATAPASGDTPTIQTPSAAKPSRPAGDGVSDDFYVEAAQADIIRVDELICFTLEAFQINSAEVRNSQGFRINKEEISHRRLEGNLIEAKKLVAYNVRANVIEARHITVKQMKRRTTPFSWPGSDSKVGQVRNKLIEIPPAPSTAAAQPH